MSVSTAVPQTSASEKDAQNWLKHNASGVQKAQFTVLLLRLAQLVAQISTFWFLAAIMHMIVVEQQAATFEQHSPMFWFVLSVAFWGVSAYFADAKLINAKHKFEAKLEKQVHVALKEQQIALSRRFSATFWQQLFLTNIGDVGDYYFQYSIQKYLSICAPIIVLCCIYPINYIVALCLMLTFPIVPLFMILVGNGAANLHRKHFVALERLGDLFADRLKALSMITAHGQHSHQLSRLSDASNIVNRKTMKVVSVAFLSSSVLDFFATVSIALIAVFIGFSLLGEINLGPAISLHQGLFMLLLAPLLFSEMRMLGKFYHQKAKAEAGAERLALISPDHVTNPHVTQKDNTQHMFTGIAWLNYQMTTPALYARKMTIQANEWVLLEGNSGSGKTALLEALMGFRQASHSLNADMALLSQQSCLLDGTIAFNLSLGHEGFSREQLEQVLVDVGLGDWLASHEKGLDTHLGDYPAISGGEAQRIALARVLLSQKSVILLDEPCAHLSHQQRDEIASLIRKTLINRTVIWVSHTPLPNDWFTQHWHISKGNIEVCP